MDAPAPERGPARNTLTGAMAVVKASDGGKPATVLLGEFDPVVKAASERIPDRARVIVGAYAPVGHTVSSANCSGPPP